MELERHIEVLLLTNDCVIVPELGGFIAHQVNARYDERDSMFLPPFRTLGFNPRLTMSDSLLAQSYADTFDLSFPEAVSRISSEVRQLKSQIEKHGSYMLNDIGRISLNSEGSYEFEPCEAGILTPWLYGLDAFELKRLQVQSASQVIPMPGRLMVATRPIEQETSEGAVQSKKPSLATIMSQIDTPNQPQEEKTISIKVSLLRNLAVTAVAAVALFLFARPVDTNQDVTNESQVAEASLVRPVLPSEPATAEMSEPRSIVGMMESVANRLSEKEEVAVVPKAGDFTIVLGYSIPTENAKSFLAELHEQGARQAILIEYHSQNAIVYGSYKSQEEAYKDLQEILSSKKANSGWIMQMK